MVIPVSIGLLVIILIINFLYNKRTKDLEERNNRLAVLTMLDEIMLSSSTDLLDISQKMIDSIPYVLGFNIGLLFLVDEEVHLLRGISISNTSAGVFLKHSLIVPFEKLEIPLSYSQNPAVRAIKENKAQEGKDFFDIFQPVLSKENFESMQKKTESGNFLIYPITAKGQAVGVLSVSSPQGKLSAYNKESLEDLVNVIGLAIDNAKVYQQLRNTSNLLASANQKLKVLDKTKDDFVSITSHELRTPMTAIRSYAWMALHRSDVPLSKSLEKYIARILISTERLINLVNDMLNVSRIESGRVEINPEPVDLISLIKDIIDEVYFSKSEEKKLHFAIQEKPIPKVFADPEKLRQVFLNLVGNSLKFTPGGGKINFDFFTDGKVVETAVSDSGVGISKEDLSKLFHKFSRLDNSYTAAATSGGTGLGLYISKSLVELMHGRIWITSQGINKGTTMTVSLPIATPEILKNVEKYRVKPAGQAKGLEPVAI